MAKLHPLLVTSLNTLPDDKHVLLFTRHSVRETVEHGVAGYDLPLTDDGVALAKHWGASIGRPVSAWHSSPVGRCVDTAKHMAEGAKSQRLEVVHQLDLVEPGCYVHDMRVVGAQFLNKGPLAFVNEFLKATPFGMLSPAQGAHKLISFFKEVKGEGGAITVLVSHDTILASFIYYLLGRCDIDEDDWPWMMEGVFLWFDRSVLHGVWRGEIFQYDFSENEVS